MAAAGSRPPKAVEELTIDAVIPFSSALVLQEVPYFSWLAEIGTVMGPWSLMAYKAWGALHVFLQLPFDPSRLETNKLNSAPTSRQDGIVQFFSIASDSRNGISNIHVPCKPGLQRRARHHVRLYAPEPPLKLLRLRSRQRILLFHSPLSNNANDRLPSQHRGSGGASQARRARSFGSWHGGRGHETELSLLVSACHRREISSHECVYLGSDDVWRVYRSSRLCPIAPGCFPDGKACCRAWYVPLEKGI